MQDEPDRVTARPGLSAAGIWVDDETPSATEISHLEDRIEHFADIAESCRKFIVAAKVSIALGGLALVGIILGFWTGSAMLMLAALSAIIGGIVVSGSNASTRRQALDAAAAAEARRADLIDGMTLRLVPGDGGDDPL
jgi:hypothetical protein